MFLWLNRLMRALIVAAAFAAVWWVWSERERAWPLADRWQSWSESGFQRPAPLPRKAVEVVKLKAPDTLQVRDAAKEVWNFGLAGVENLALKDGSRKATQESWQAATNILGALPGQQVAIAYTSATPLHTGLGFFYPGSNDPVHLRLVRTGWYRIQPEQRRLLPLEEQVALRAAERAARRQRMGAWGSLPE